MVKPKDYKLGKRYIRRFEIMLVSPAYRDLSTVARCLLEEFQRIYRPGRNGSLSISTKNAEKLLNVCEPTVQDCVNVRDDSNTSANIIACLAANTPLAVLSSRPYWREIEFGQAQPGWIAKKFIIPSPTPPVVPVPDPLPNDMWLTVHFIDRPARKDIKLVYKVKVDTDDALEGE